MVKQKIQRGKVLLAEPFMLDPNFKRAVVLLCEHEKDGSLGFILNKTLDMSINELVLEFPKFEAQVYYGGPVQTDTIHYIHNVGHLLDDSNEIAPGIFWGGSFDKLKALIDAEMVEPNNIRFFVGYSGWTSGQLREELKYGSWVVGEMHGNYLFKSQPKMLWKKAMQHKGDIYTVIAEMPESSSN